MNCEFVEIDNGDKIPCEAKATERSRADLEGEELYVCRKHAEERVRELAGQFRSWSTSELRKIVTELQSELGKPIPDHERVKVLTDRHRAIVEEADSFLTRLGVVRAPVVQT
jgi:hypothetical protein